MVQNIVLLSGTARPSFGDSRARTILLHEHTMSHRTIEKEGQASRLFDGARQEKVYRRWGDLTPYPSTCTPGRVNLARVNEVSRSTGSVQELQPTSSRHQVLQRTLVVLQRGALLWARQVSKISAMVRLVVKKNKHRPNSSARHRKITTVSRDIILLIQYYYYTLGEVV